MANNEQSDVTANKEPNSEQPLTGRARSLANLRPYPKGKSGNPKGRPKTPITDWYRKLAKRKFPTDKEGRKYAQLVAEAQFRQAIKGKTDAAKEITDRIEGKVVQATHISGPDGEPITVNVDVKERIRAIAERLRSRGTKSG
jgi:hypothetical protein